MNNLVVVILAAGEGTRMKSNITKVCHKVGEKTMIEHVVSTAKSLKPLETVVIVSKDNINQIRDVVLDNDLRFKIQYEQLGTGHAVKTVLPCLIKNNSNLLVLLGDVPLISSHTLNKIVSTNHDAVVAGFRDHNSKNKFGRIIISKNKLHKIVEYLDATPAERNVPLCNSGILWIKNTHVPLIKNITNNNKKSEYYLTDIVGMMREKGLEIGFLEASYDEFMGVNTQEDLLKVNNIYNNNNNKN